VTIPAAIGAQLRGLRRTLLGFSLPVLGLLCGAWLLHRATGISIRRLTADPAVVLRWHPLTGMLFHLGVLLWNAAAAICFFCYSVAAGRAPRRHRTMLLAAGLLTTLLVLDDLFLFHERLFPKYLGLPEPLTCAGYAVLVLVYLWAFRREILQTDFLLLALALGCFGVSVICDQFFADRPWGFLEDGAKLLGIAWWCAYFARVGRRALSSPAPL